LPSQKRRSTLLKCCARCSAAAGKSVLSSRCGR